jgi:hypothetical protein
MKTVSFASKGEGEKYLLYGWSTPEKWGTWSDGDSSGISLKLAKNIDRDLVLRIHAHAFISEKHHKQEVAVLVNRHLLGTIDTRQHLIM